MKYGPCESAVEPVLQQNNIRRQKYFGGAFIGNHVHRALQRQTTHAITRSHVQIVVYRCPDLLPKALLVADRYNKLMTLYADCREIFSRSDAVSPQNDLEQKIVLFMASAAARSEIVCRSLGNITPKLHLFEGHVVASMKRFDVGLGLLGEQGRESIHAQFNSLSRTFNSAVHELNRLTMVMRQHCWTTLPQQVAKVPLVNTHNGYKSSEPIQRSCRYPVYAGKIV